MLRQPSSGHKRLRGMSGSSTRKTWKSKRKNLNCVSGQDSLRSASTKRSSDRCKTRREWCRRAFLTRHQFQRTPALLSCPTICDSRRKMNLLVSKKSSDRSSPISRTCRRSRSGPSNRKKWHGKRCRMTAQRQHSRRLRKLTRRRVKCDSKPSILSTRCAGFSRT